MLKSTKGRLPPIDYVSLISSVYSDRRAILFGTLASAIAAFASAWSAQSTLLVFHGLAFLITAFWRFSEATRFAALEIEDDDAALAEKWEQRAMWTGGIAGLNYGLWCFSSLVFVNDPFSELAATTVTIAALVGVVARNFGLVRLIQLQSALVGVPLCSALVLTGDVYHAILASLFAPMILSFLSVAADIRRVLLTAVHDRVAVTKLVNELDTTLETISHGVCMLDDDLKVAVANPQFVQLVFGDSVVSPIGEDFKALIRQAENFGQLSRLTSERLQTAIATRKATKIVLPLIEQVQCELSLTVSAGQIALVVEDISERIEAENKIRFMARYDGLTGLPNRVWFTEQVNARIHEARHSSHAAPSMLAVIDLDDFKHINDSMGHPVGDALLQQVADRIQLHCSSGVVVGRFGGDEFTIFNEQNMDAENADRFAARLMEVLSAPYRIGEEIMIVRFSLGYVLCSQCDGQLEEMFKRADLALYAAKSQGKGRYCQFHSNMSQEYNERQILKRALKDALSTGQLSLAYQPIVDLKEGRIKGCEALSRWTHPEHGTIPPSIFIPIAEEIGMMGELTQWVLNTATSECTSWPDDIYVSVNISARDFQSGRVERMIDSALASSGLDPRRLEIEVTESVLIEERDRASITLRTLADRGLGIALDDFGTGYSSLAYVHDMPFTKIKIDRAFTEGVTHDQRSLKLMRSIAHMSKELDMRVTVEGVETDEQLQVISNLGLVDQVQGYLFGIPVPQSEISTLINTLRVRHGEHGKTVQSSSGRIVAKMARSR